MEEILRKFNIDRESLNSVEMETLEKWSKALSQNVLHVHDIKNYIDTMITSLERDLFSDEAPMTFANLFFRKSRKRNQEARLKNYVLLRDFLTAPERARSIVEKQLSGFKN